MVIRWSNIRLFMFILLVSCRPGNEASMPLDGERAEDPFSATDVQETLEKPETEDGDRLDGVGDHRQNAITRAVERAGPAVVSITVTERVERSNQPQDDFFRYFFGEPVPREYTNMGSGFLISEDGLIVTNHHVTGSQPTEIRVSLPDGSDSPATLVGTDELTDLSLLKVDVDRPLPFIKFSDSEQSIVGEWAVAIGNPFGLFEDGVPSVSVGVISATNRDFRPDPNNPRIYVDMIQTDAAINRGNSGGPLVNSNGELIGVNTFIFTGGTSDGFVGLGFAIPSNRVDQIVGQLLHSGQVGLDYDPGMDYTSMTEQLVFRYRLPAVQGLLVTQVNQGGPAFEAGVLPGDIILRIGEDRVLSEMHANAILREYDEGDDMTLHLLREGREYETTLLLRQRIPSADPIP
ncbi:MAG: trypsin-like peptidase domain-containing protein [Balneolaceae bacterium]